MQESQQHADTILASVLGRLDGQGDEYASTVVAKVRSALMLPAKGTMRSWMESHNGLRLTTIQVHNGTGTSWSPTGRTIDATHPSSVQLSGSTRDYRGMCVVSTAPNVLIVADNWHTIAYIVEETTK